MTLKSWLIALVAIVAIASLASIVLAGNASGLKSYPSLSGPPLDPSICNVGAQGSMECDTTYGICVDGQWLCRQFCYDVNNNPTNGSTSGSGLPIKWVHCSDSN
ncbi:hypothetical protein [Nitrospira sp. BLG_2]|uniref:hypothetical protein n=1 Tax=Nitrospira sp. BLG_2 TaxID=3397507 RepID=UPI003B9AFCE1